MRRSCQSAFILLLTFILIFTFAACNGGTTSTTTGSTTQSQGTTGATTTKTGTSETEPQIVEITAFAQEGPYTKKDFNDLAIWEVATAATGVKVNFESSPADGFAEKLSLKFSTNDLPDMFFKCNMSNSDIAVRAGEGQLIPIDGYLDDHAPNFSKYLANEISIERGIRMADGHIYGFCYLVSGGGISSKFFYNSKWINKQGLELPKTTDELYTMLTTMKDFDYNGNSQKDEIPFIVESLSRLEGGLFGSFGLGTRGGNSFTWDIDPVTNELRYVRTSDGYKKFLEFANKLYTEKLLDQECFTMDLTKFSAKIALDIFGVTIAGNSSYFNVAQNDQLYPNAPLIGPDGYQIAMHIGPPLAGQNTFITNKNQHVEETVSFVDYFYSEEGITLYFMGIEGETYYYDDKGKPQFFDKVLKNPDGLNPEDVLGDYVCWSGGGNPSVADYDHFYIHFSTLHNLTAANVLMDYKPKELWGAFIYSTEDSEKLKILQTEIDTYATDMRAKFISGEIGFDSWDDYVQQIEALGIDQYEEIVQRGMDAYIS
jgi:putative aldouronate transport system substrate-binding protein